MAVMSFYTVMIELAAPNWDRRPPQAEKAFDCVIHLAQMRPGSPRAFALYEGQQPVYVLDESENGALLSLLEKITMRAPWDATVGRDGTTCTLKLIGPMSYAEFNWWVKAPKGWESVGAIFDYVISLAKRHGYSPALCG